MDIVTIDTSDKQHCLGCKFSEREDCTIEYKYETGFSCFDGAATFSHIDLVQPTDNRQERIELNIGNKLRISMSAEEASYFKSRIERELSKIEK